MEQGFRQTVVAKYTRDVLCEFIYLVKRRHAMQIFEKKKWHRKLSKLGVKRSHHRYIFCLSKRMMLAAYNPKFYRPASKWKKRYERDLKPYIRFQKPEACYYVYVSIDVKVTYSDQNTYSFEFAYYPQTDFLKRLSVKPLMNFKDMGLRQFQVNNLGDLARKKGIYAWKQYLTYQLFKDPA